MRTDTKDLKNNDPGQGVKGCVCGESRVARIDMHIACQIERGLPGKEKGPGQARPPRYYAFGAAAGGTVVTEAFS